MSLRKVSPSEESRKLASALSRHGFDICQTFHTSWYNHQLDREGLSLCRLPAGNALLIANTKRLWPFFLTWLKQQQQQQQQEGAGTIPPNPLDTFVTSNVTTLVRQHVGDDNNFKIFWDHDWDKDKLVSMSRLASVSGLCYLHPTALLSIHPEYGPWISLRAVVVLCNNNDTDAASVSLVVTDPPPAPGSLSNPLSAEQDAIVREAAKRAFEHAHVFDQGSSASTGTEAAARPWIALRDSVPIGRSYRFSDRQLTYHYIKDVRLLEEEIQTMT